MTSDSGHPNLLTAKTGDHLWRLVRKGVAPAFNPQNIRSVNCPAEASALPDTSCVCEWCLPLVLSRKVNPLEDELLCRQGFTYVLEAVDQLIAVLKERGSERAVDMDDAAQRVSLEVTSHEPEARCKCQLMSPGLDRCEVRAHGDSARTAPASAPARSHHYLACCTARAFLAPHHDVGLPRS